MGGTNRAASDLDPVNDGALLTAFYDALQANPRDPLPHVLSAKQLLPQPGYKTLLLLHWRHVDRVTDWNANAREAWERFCRETLAAACPPSLNILALLPVTIGDNELRAIEHKINILRKRNLQQTNYSLLRLPALSALHVEEVRDSLVDKMDPRYSKELLEDLPSLILR